MTTSPRRAWHERALSLFTDVRAGEGATALLLTLNAFLLLTAYYILKPVREGLITAGQGGAELKSFASAGQATLLVAVVLVVDALGRRFGPLRIITVVSLFFAANLGIFYTLVRAAVPVGVVFFLWVGVFSVTVVAQFWAFANDLYTPDQGKRLFPVIAAGSAVGAIAGSEITRWLRDPIGTNGLLLVSAGVLLSCLCVTWLVHVRESRRASLVPPPPREQAQVNPTRISSPGTQEAPLGKRFGFSLILQNRYLLLLAALVVLLNWVNSNGEYVFDRAMKDAFRAGIADGSIHGLSERDFITQVRNDFFRYVNWAVLFVQLFVTSRLFRFAGLRKALFVLPLISLVGSSLLAFLPIFAIVRVTKVAENATDYSVMNTTRQALWLVTSREEKYKAKAAIDTVLMRVGDVLSLAVVAIGSSLQLVTGQFALINVVLVCAWLTVAFLLSREHARRDRAGDAG